MTRRRNNNKRSKKIIVKEKSKTFIAKRSEVRSESERLKEKKSW
jgi:hypothetical protein